MALTGMNLVLTLLTIQGVLGGWDTLYYHEFRARLPAGMPGTEPELRLHAYRSLIYAVLFFSLPRWSFHGIYILPLLALLTVEIVITLRDFVVEDRVRVPMGGVFPGERVMHAVMGILYGAMLANLLPILWRRWDDPAALAPLTGVSENLRIIMPLMALGVLLSGIRDLAASLKRHSP